MESGGGHRSGAGNPDGVEADITCRTWQRPVLPDLATSRITDEKVDYARIVPALRAAGYNGWVSFEYEEPEATGIPRPLAYLKRMLAGWSTEPRNGECRRRNGIADRRCR